jgi:hypothetical protein
MSDHSRPPAHHNAPPGTSERAAAQIAEHTPTLRERVAAFIVSRGPEGATDEEAGLALRIRAQTLTPRRGELVKAGRVVDSGRRRRTTTGRTAAVWVVVEYAPQPMPERTPRRSAPAPATDHGRPTVTPSLLRDATPAPSSGGRP